MADTAKKGKKASAAEGMLIRFLILNIYVLNNNHNNII